MSWTTTDFFIKFCLEMNANVFLREKEKYKKNNFYVCRIFWHFCNADWRVWMVLRDSVLKMQTRNLQFVINGDFFSFWTPRNPFTETSFREEFPLFNENSNKFFFRIKRINWMIDEMFPSSIWKQLKFYNCEKRLFFS